MEDGGCVRCDAAPQFVAYMESEDGGMFTEVHMDDLHGCGERPRIERLQAHLAETVKIKEFDIHETSAATYSHLKRCRETTITGTNKKCGRTAIAAMGLLSMQLVTAASAEAMRSDDAGKTTEGTSWCSARC